MYCVSLVCNLFAQAGRLRRARGYLPLHLLCYTSPWGCCSLQGCTPKLPPCSAHSSHSSPTSAHHTRHIKRAGLVRTTSFSCCLYSAFLSSSSARARGRWMCRCNIKNYSLNPPTPNSIFILFLFFCFTETPFGIETAKTFFKTHTLT